MSVKLYPEDSIQAIASAIRAKNGSSETYTVSQMASAITNIPSGGGGGSEDLISLIDRSITSIDNSEVTRVGVYAFQSCTALTTASLPAVTTIGNSAFYACYTLTSVNLPVATSIGNNAFQYCYSLASVSLPVATSIGNSVFNGCSSLTSVSLPAATSIGNSAFYNCRLLLSIHLMGSSVVNLIASNAFNSTPIGGYTASTSGQYGSIFVPASLYDSYISATNWSFFSSRFVSVPEE